MSTPGQVIVQTIGSNLVEVITAGPQGPTGPIGNSLAGPTGPTGPPNGPTGPTGPPGEGGGGAGTLGQQSLSLRTNFNTWIAANASDFLVADYQFGSAVVPAPGVTAITNETQLAQYFNPFEDFTAETSINSEIQRYQPFNNANHVFNANNLTLQAVNPNGDWNCTAITQISGTVELNNTPTAIANLGLANTAAVQLGQMCAIQGGGGVGGNYYITAIVANTSVTLQALPGSPTAPVSGGSTGLIFWLPVVGVALSATYDDGGDQFTFASVPPFVQEGMALGVYNSPLSGTTLNRSADWLVTNITGNVVTFAPAMTGLPNLAVGQIIWFLPHVTSGQIWSQLQLDMTNYQAFFAFEVNMTTLDSITTLTAVGTDGQLTLAEFNAFPNTTPLGAWFSDWCYSANDGNSAAETSSASELDMQELQVGCTQDITYMNEGDVSDEATLVLFGKNDSGWSYQTAFGIARCPAGTTFVGEHLYQCIVTNGFAYRFLDGVLYSAKQFVWTNQRPMQFAVNIACGGLDAALMGNTIFPNNTAGFAAINVAISEIKVWYQAAPGGG
jgi:hypothetical protein